MEYNKKPDLKYYLLN